MTKARVSNDLPRPVSAFAVVFWGKSVPADVQEVFDIIWLALQQCHGGGRTELFNRKMGQLRRRRPHVIANLRRWLLNAKTQQALCKAGHSYLVGCWLSSLQRFQDGATASAAFNRPGRPTSWQFTDGARRAFRVEQMRRAGISLNRAIESVLGPTRTDDRELRRMLSSIRGSTMPAKFFAD